MQPNPAHLPVTDFGVGRYRRGRSFGRWFAPRFAQQRRAQIGNQCARECVEFELVGIVTASGALPGADSYDRQPQHAVQHSGFDVDGPNATARYREQLLLEDTGAQLNVDGADAIRGGEIAQETVDHEQRHHAESPVVVTTLAAENKGNQQDRKQFDYLVDRMDQQHPSVEAKPRLFLLRCFGSRGLGFVGNLDHEFVDLAHVASLELVPAIAVSCATVRSATS